MTQSVICRGRWASLRQLQGRRRVVEILVGWDRYHCTYSGFIKLSWLLNRRLLSSLNHVVWYTFHMAQKYKRFSSHTAVMSGHKSHHHTVLSLWDCPHTCSGIISIVSAHITNYIDFVTINLTFFLELPHQAKIMETFALCFIHARRLACIVYSFVCSFTPGADYCLHSSMPYVTTFIF